MIYEVFRPGMNINNADRSCLQEGSPSEIRPQWREEKTLTYLMKVEEENTRRTNLFFLFLPLLYLVEIEMMQGFVWGNHVDFLGT